MKNWFTSAAVAVLVSTILVSCNIYSPLSSPSTSEQFEEEARRCLHDGDYACAVENYSKLPEGQPRSEKLCTANMAWAGLGLAELIDVISDRTSGSKLMGTLAQQFVPWTAQKQSAAEAAKTACSQLQTAATAGEKQQLNTLLKALGSMMDCSIRMAKADMYTSTSNGGACTAVTSPNGKVEATDISVSALGTVSSVSPGMCSDDAIACGADMAAVAASALSNAGLGDIQGNVDAIPANARSGNADTARSGLRDTTLY